MELKNSFSVCNCACINGQRADGLHDVHTTNQEIIGKAMEKLKRKLRKNFKKRKPPP
jgi:hypothetical protein